MPMPYPIRALLLSIALAAITINALPQNPLTAFPNNYKLALDNADVSVIRAHYGPHESVGVHDHSRFPTIYVYLSDSGPVRFSHDETPPFVITRPPTTLGSFRVSPGRIERHTVENLGDQSSDYLRIELKKLPLKNTLHPVRGTAPAKLQSGISEEFSSPELTIHRIVCNPGQTCPVRASSSPTLLVAFSPVKVLTSGPTHTEKEMQGNDIQWLATGGDFSVTASSVPAHLLEVELHQLPK
jgi:hypothetical protein